MTDVGGPFDNAQWSQDQWYRHAPKWTPSGVNGTPASSTTTGDLALTFSGLNFTVGTGRAWVRGAGFERSGSPASQAIAANTNASLSRRDRVVLRRDLAAKTLAPTLILGTASSSPTAPAIQQNETGQWDLLLFSFLVPPNSGTTITGIVDERVWVNPDTRPDRTIGDAYLAAVTLIGGPTTWNDFAVVTGTSTGGLCVARISTQAFNGNSGLDRTIDLQVTCDGVAIGSMGGILIPIANTRPIDRFISWSSTPTAGSHTWRLQARASAATSVYMESALLTVVER